MSRPTAKFAATWRGGRRAVTESTWRSDICWHPGAARRVADMTTYSARAKHEDAHEEGIWSVGWSSNGQLVTGGCDELVQSFMVHSHEIEPKHELRGHQLGMCPSARPPWPARAGATRSGGASHARHLSPAGVISVSAEGNLAASSSLDTMIRLWDLEHGTELRTIDAGPIEAWTVSLFADGQAVASGSQGGNVNLWSVASGEKQATSVSQSVGGAHSPNLVASAHELASTTR